MLLLGNSFYESSVSQLVALPLERFQLRTLRRPMDGRGRIETQHTWIEATSASEAIAQGAFLVEAVLEGCSGIAMLTNDTGALIWSMRKGMPRPEGPGSI